ncbi:zinc-ribbon domain-containing protein [Celeribacter litoreus]|uniref:zinc-ribbon domain-containing protein n=1 Tax=Celeribacter litoreus TaxID=2876714 RepID=UPI001CCE6E19|nr:zinc-ribbon domain-containing protein [Celeribacter litoreus]MCA0044339.1 zinc-ribbon domain-containing protein [Celeribacter litoreus]
MRLICPNCGAQYEVDARVIPAKGRDVQCSNCGQTWFQNAPEAELPKEPLASSAEPEKYSEEAAVAAISDPEPVPEAAPEEDPILPPEYIPDETPVEEPEPEVTFAEGYFDAPAEEPAAEFESVPEVDDSFEGTTSLDDDFEDFDDDEATFEPNAPRPQLDDSVRDILRAEVEFDQSLRETEEDASADLPDATSDEDTSSVKSSLRDRMARLRGVDPTEPSEPVEPEPGAPTPVKPRRAKSRDVFPDIEEINSSLSSSSDRYEDGRVTLDDETDAAEGRSGFRRAYSVVILIVVLLVALYAFAPMLADKVPALTPVLSAYVGVANEFRAWLDQLLTGASVRLNAFLIELNAD